ncbi:MAG TPA: hypothetical protein VFY83_04640 [Anaerolineales bacterium]|nr:hypothetical protein [Anaerolineales bacterium]
MKKHTICSLMIFLALLLSMFTVASPVYAGDSLQGRPANLTLEPLPPLVVGDHPTIVAYLTAEFGQPIRNQPILIFVDGQRRAEGRTDSRGIAAINLRYKFEAGTYRVEAVYPGIQSIGVNRATAEVAMVIEPARTAIYTVPPVPGLAFKLNNQKFVTDETGVANIEVNTSGLFTLEVLPIDEAALPANIRMEFARWNDNVFTQKRQVYFPRTRRLEVGFTVSYQVNQEFFDLKGEPVDPSRIDSMTVRGVGNTFTFDKAGPIWLPANRLTRRIGERLESEEILYYFREITIDGANVVNKSEQRFRIRPDDVWPVEVLLYTARFSARDAMFRFPIGTGIALTHPDGHTEEFLFTDPKNAEVTVTGLARGSYSARIIGAGGSAPPTPVHLSRDQNVELLMLSYLDIVLILGIPLLIALTFFFIGRPYWLRIIRHPSKYRELVYQNTSREASPK